MRELKRQAADAIAEGRPELAASRYAELERLEPADPEWSRRLADCHRRSGRDEPELEALGRASRKYAQNGFTLKAIALCKLVLARRPDDRETLDELARLHGERGLPTRSDLASAPRRPPPRRPRRAALSAPPRAEASPDEAGAPLGDLALPDLVATRTERGADETGLVHELEIDELIEEIVDGLAPPAPPAPARTAPSERSQPSEELQPATADDASAALSSGRLRRAPLFSELSGDTLQRLIRDVQLVTLAAGESVFRQGDRADSLYVVAEGRLRATAERARSVELARYEEGDVFGEMGLVSNQPRGATITADTDAQLLRLTRRSVHRLSEQSELFATALLRLLRERFVQNLVEESPLLSATSVAERQAFVESFSFVDVDAGTTLVAQGRPAPGLFVLLGGRCLVITRSGSREQCLAELGSGDVFGEMSLLGATNALASVTATSRSFLLRADPQAFVQLSMTHPSLLAHVSRLRDEREAQNAEALREFEHQRLTLL